MTSPCSRATPLARRAAPTVCADTLGACAQRLLIRFELLPGDVAGVRVRQKDLPLLARKSSIPRLAAGTDLALPGPPEDVRAGVARIVQDVEHTATLQLAEDERTCTGSLDDPPWPCDLLLLEVSHHRAGRAGAVKGVEHEADGALHLLVGIEHELSPGGGRGPYPAEGGSTGRRGAPCSVAPRSDARATRGAPPPTLMLSAQ